MKKFYPILLCMAGLLWMNTACDDSDEGQGQGPEKESTETAMKYVTATYVGEQNACGFFTFDFCTEPTGENEAIPANASGLHIELYSDVVAPENLLDASIAPGRYATGETPGKFTIQSGQTAEGRVTGSYYYTTQCHQAPCNRRRDLLRHNGRQSGGFHLRPEDRPAGKQMGVLRIQRQDRRRTSLQYGLHRSDRMVLGGRRL